MPFARLPRFRRSAEAAAFQLTKRDIEILRHVHRHRFLRSSQIAGLTGGSAQQVLRRLHLLYHHGYLDRPRCQIDYYYQGGSRSMVYGLTKRGTSCLARTGNISRIDWKIQNSAVTRFFMEHTLRVAEFMVGLEVACRASGKVHLIWPEETPVATTGRNPPFKWEVTVNTQTKLGVIPDRVFGLEFADTGERSYYFLEADCATMPVLRHNFERTSFYRKLLAYHSTWEQDIHRSRLGMNRFRVLSITTTPQRVNHLVEACGKLQNGHGLFLFTDLESFKTFPDPLSLPWKTGRSGESVSLVPQPALF